VKVIPEELSPEVGVLVEVVVGVKVELDVELVTVVIGWSMAIAQSS